MVSKTLICGSASSAEVRLCPGCGSAQHIPALTAGTIGKCRECGTVLRRVWPSALRFTMAAALAAVPLLAIGSTQTLALVEKVGREQSADLLAGPIALMQHGLWELAALVALTTLVMPGLGLALLLATLFGVRRRPGKLWVARAFAWRNRLKPWAMIDVFLVGYFVAYTKLGALVHVEPGPGFWALGAFMLVMTALDAVLDTQTVWDAAGLLAAPPPEAAKLATTVGQAALACETCGLACTRGAVCPRCASRLEARKANALSLTAAFSLAALTLYLPANVLPVLSITQLGQGSPSTILGGVAELIGAHEWPLAAIVFGASVAVPVLKILALATVLWAAARGPARHTRQLTTLYHVILVIGRWSMIDIFMESILSALVQFGTAAEVDPGPGAVPFAAVVVLTMLAAERFDPRLMWDKVRT